MRFFLDHDFYFKNFDLQKVILKVKKPPHQQKIQNPNLSQSTPLFIPKIKIWLFRLPFNHFVKTSTPLRHHRHLRLRPKISVFAPPKHHTLTIKPPRRLPKLLKAAAHPYISRFFNLLLTSVKPQLPSTYHRKPELGYQLKGTLKVSPTHFHFLLLVHLQYLTKDIYNQFPLPLPLPLLLPFQTL